MAGTHMACLLRHSFSTERGEQRAITFVLGIRRNARITVTQHLQPGFVKACVMSSEYLVAAMQAGLYASGSR